MAFSIGPSALVILGLVVLFMVLVRKGREEFAEVGHAGAGEPRRHLPPPLPAPRRRERPVVSAGQLIFAIILSPFVLFFWALASLGDFLAIPIHAAVGILSGAVALLISLIGVYPRRLWRLSGLQFRHAGKAGLRAGARLLSAFGFGGLVDRLQDDVRAVSAPSAPPAAGRAAFHAGPRTYPFEDRYRIESTLTGGGSTARLFIVRRVQDHRPVGDRLVLKYFDMGLGSRLEDVVRETRGMQEAKAMGIVLDHHLAADHFYYVMPYYEGETLTRAAARIHRTLGSGEPMPAGDVGLCLEWTAELLRILDGYHRHGVIHKDVKPDNLIVASGGLKLIDIGLLTPLASAMTLTTHGTEYFRDPEMVKLAVQGKRVKDVDAARFDVYSSGAVLYYLLEGSFPACGPLSRFTRPVPMALSVVVSRAMAEGTKRYPSVAAMRVDLEAVRRELANGNLDRMPVNRLPSLSEGEVFAAADVPPVPVLADYREAPPAPSPAARSAAPRRRFFRWPFVPVLLGVFVVAWFVRGRNHWEPPSPVAHRSTPAEAIPTESAVREFERRARAELGAALAGRLSHAELRDLPVLLAAAGDESLRHPLHRLREALAAGRVPMIELPGRSEALADLVARGAPATEFAPAVSRLDLGAQPIVLAMRESDAPAPGGRWVELRFLYGSFERLEVLAPEDVR